MDFQLQKRDFRPARVSGAYPAPTQVAPRRPLNHPERVPVVLIHPGNIERLGLHYSWSTSAFVEICAAGANEQEVNEALRSARARVALLGIAAVDRFTGVSEVSNVTSIQRCLRSYPKIKWIVWSSLPSMAYREAAKAAGAIGYFDVPMTSDQLESAVEWAAAGRPIGWTNSSAPMTAPTRSAEAADSLVVTQSPPVNVGLSLSRPAWQLDSGHGLPQHVAQREVTNSSDKPIASIPAATQESRAEDLPTGPKLDDLSQREREVLQGLAAGRTNQQIADELYLSVKTIETYRSRLKQKLGMWHRSEMVAFFHSLV